MKSGFDLRYALKMMVMIPLVMVTGLFILGVILAALLGAPFKQLIAFSVKLSFIGLLPGVWWGMIQGIVVPLKAGRLFKMAISFILGAVMAPVLLGILYLVLVLLEDKGILDILKTCVIWSPLVGGPAGAAMWFTLSKTRNSPFSTIEYDNIEDEYRSGRW